MQSRLLLFTFIITIFACNTLQPKSDNLSKIKNDVKFLSDDKLEGRETGTKGEELASQYIKNRFVELGIEPKGENGTYFHNFSKTVKKNDHTDNSSQSKIVNGKNIIAWINNGSKKSILIGAHYDHLGYGKEGSLATGNIEGDPKYIHNGADDNASGVASLLYLAEKLKNLKSKYNFIFIAFSGEEKGLLGSNSFVDYNKDNLPNFEFMINMDMVGRLDKENRLAVYGVGTSPILVDLVNNKNTYDFQLTMDSSGVGPSDHTSFYLENIPVLHFFTGQHNDYHRPTDDYNKINYEGLRIISNYIYEIVDELDNYDDIVFTKTKDNNDKKSSNYKVTLGVIPDYLFDGKGMKIDGVKPGKTAEKYGLQKDDIVIQLGDYEITDMMSYVNCLTNFNVGDTTKVIVLRNGQSVEKEIIFLEK